MKRVVQVRIFKGEKLYVAECLDLPVVTPAATLDELAANLKEAIALHLQGEDLATLGLNAYPAVIASFERRRRRCPSLSAFSGSQSLLFLNNSDSRSWPNVEVVRSSTECSVMALGKNSACRSTAKSTSVPWGRSFGRLAAIFLQISYAHNFYS